MEFFDRYNIEKKPDYAGRSKLWLDGGVSMARSDEPVFPRIDNFEVVARSFFWTPEEISVQKDRIDMKSATPAEKHMYSANLLRQTTLDAFQTPFEVFSPVASHPEIIKLLRNWDFFESNIHSRSYEHIIKAVYDNPSRVLDKVHDIPGIVAMAKSIGRYYSALNAINIRVASGEVVDKMEHKRAILLALHSSYGLEAIRFMTSFITSLRQKENGKFVGNAAIIELIMQDEMLHTEWTADLINLTLETDPDMRALQKQCMPEIVSLYKDIVDDEKGDWVDYLCLEGPIDGLNERILRNVVDWEASKALPLVGVEYFYESPEVHPAPWFENSRNLSMKQTALQETESVDYVVGMTDGVFDYSKLPTI